MMKPQAPSFNSFPHSSTSQFCESRDTSTSGGMQSIMKLPSLLCVLEHRFGDLEGDLSSASVGLLSAEAMVPTASIVIELRGRGPTKAEAPPCCGGTAEVVPCIQLSLMTSSSFMLLLTWGSWFRVDSEAMAANFLNTSSNSRNSLSSSSSSSSGVSFWMPAANLKICLQCPRTTPSMRSRGVSATTAMLLLISRPNPSMTVMTRTREAMFAVASCASTSDMS
mmetsp:Transcript_42798/g.97438  ORF Transcript_42798/g.97438 Transcript_42798/m.97438 type:complete len:223 (+) Transcript_42798:1068-1736(+)